MGISWRSRSSRSAVSASSGPHLLLSASSGQSARSNETRFGSNAIPPALLSPPSISEIGRPATFPAMSQSAISNPLRANIVTPYRPKIWFLTASSFISISICSGSRPIASGAIKVSIAVFVVWIALKPKASPYPVMPSSVSTLMRRCPSSCPSPAMKLVEFPPCVKGIGMGIASILVIFMDVFPSFFFSGRS